MKTLFRGLLVGGLSAIALGAGLVGCSANTAESEEFGELNLPLATYGSSGAQYRLRDAKFEIVQSGGWGWAGSGAGATTGAEPITVSSEDDPDSDSISVSLEEGSYYVTLLPGWHMEKLGASGYETVEAQLLSSEGQYVYITPRSSSWAEFRFGIGERELWLNGKLNITIDVSEDPDECKFNGYYYEGNCDYGTGGAAGSGGWVSAGAAGTINVGTGGTGG